MGKTKEYTNGEVTIVWKPELCYHSGVCVRGLPEVFKPQEKPWIKIDKATTEALVSQVKECPSGALSYYMNDNGNPEEKIEDSVEVEVRKNGPLVVKGTCRILHKDGREEIKENATSFCRCGASGNKPFCDGSHRNNHFEG